MRAVAERLFSALSTRTPEIVFACFNFYRQRLVAFRAHVILIPRVSPGFQVAFVGLAGVDVFQTDTVGQENSVFLILRDTTSQSDH